MPPKRKPRRPRHGDTFERCRDLERAMRDLPDPDKTSRRLRAQQNRIEHWIRVTEEHPPGTFKHWRADVRFRQELAADPFKPTAGDALADWWFEVWWQIKIAAFQSLYVLVLVVVNVLWFGFLIFVALPVVWDWFWQLPPGLR